MCINLKYNNNYFTLLLLIIFFSFILNYNTNNCIDTNLCLKNLSLNYKNSIPYSCNNSNSLNIPFHENRKWNNNPNYIVATIYYVSIC